MKLYYRDTGTQITNVNISHCQKIINTGGRLAVMKQDRDLAGITAARGLLMQQVEVRKNDGSTVIWEGVIEKLNYNKDGYIFEGNEYLSVLGGVNSRYNGIIDEGTVTSLADDYIVDTELTTGASMVGKYVGFVDTDVLGTNEVTFFPNSNTDFFNGGVAADTETGAFGDLATSGNTSMYLFDENSRAKDYYGIECKYTVTNHATVKRIMITLDMGFQSRSSYDATDEPLVRLWDDDGSAWVDSDISGDMTGLGRLNAVTTGWGRPINTRLLHTVTISDNIGKYMDGSGLLILRITCGDGNAAKDSIALYSSNLTARIYTTYDANSEAYVIDDTDTNKLIFTGQTPNADGVAINDAYRIGDPLHTVMGFVWQYAPISGLTLDFDSTTLYDATDLRQEKVGALLLTYGSRLNRIVYQKIGWELECKTSLTATGIELTETDLKNWTLDVDGQEVVSGVVAMVNQISHDVYGYNLGYHGLRDRNDTDWGMSSEQLAAAAGPNELAYSEVVKVLLAIRVDLDGAAPGGAGAWADLDIGKTITVDLYSSQLTIAAGTIREISYSQEGNGHLFADIIIEA